ncbi:MAG: hypothetical protein ACERKZ_17560 [Lachnotalea sp.]
MVNVGGVIANCKIELYKWKKDYRVSTIFIIMGIVLFYYTSDIVNFMKMTGTSISQWLFPMLFGDYIVSMGLFKVLILFGIIILYCNAPFVDNIYSYVTIRSGFMTWCLGEILYIIVSSLFFVLYIVILTIIRFIPRVEFISDWGKVIGTLTLTNAGTTYTPLLVFSDKVVLNYNPLYATIITIILLWLISIMLGLILFVFNTFNRWKGLGVLICTFLILIDPLIIYFEKSSMIRFSPISWLSIENLKSQSMSNSPTVMYAIGMLIVINIVLICIALKQDKRNLMN